MAGAGDFDDLAGRRDQRRSGAQFVDGPERVRGYLPGGLLDSSFRGRNAARNATFCDLMARTGLRLTEQASLSVFEIPEIDVDRAYAPIKLPSAIAKNESGRRIYIPIGVLREIWDYMRFDRAELIDRARVRGTYNRLPGKLIVEDPQHAAVTVDGRIGRRRSAETLNPRQRRRLFVCRPDGLEPAALWLNQDGLPVMPGTWQSMFTDANERCLRHGVGLRAHPHLLRHTYAVVTLEQLQREHIRELGTMNSTQRTSYEQIFGDPFDWVRRRLGHRLVGTTFKYLEVSRPRLRKAVHAVEKITVDQFGASPIRGAGGPLHITVPRDLTRCARR